MKGPLWAVDTAASRVEMRDGRLGVGAGTNAAACSSHPRAIPCRASRTRAERSASSVTGGSCGVAFVPEVDTAIRLVAQAYGYGRVLVSGGFTVGKAQPWQPTDRMTGDGDESNPAASPGLAICKPSETIEKAGTAINPKSPGHARWLNRMEPGERQAVDEWNAQAAFAIRGRGKAYRFGEFQHWQQTQGVMVFPQTRPRRCVLLALAVAKLDGPLDAWLHVVAAGHFAKWPDVRRYVVACGHEGWAADEAAYRLCVRREPIRVRAKLQGIRAARYAAEVDRAEARLREWLERACFRLLAVYEREGGAENYGEPSGLRAETWWHPARSDPRRAGNPKQRRHGVRSRQEHRPPGACASRAAPRRRAATIRTGAMA